MYTAKLEELKEIEPGCWHYSVIGVYKGEEKIGEYVREYPNYGVATFAPFERNGQWYALYSEDYTCISIMELPSMKKIGGENPDSFGFCPVEIFVPRYTKEVIKGMTPEILEKLNIPEQNRERASKDKHYKEYEILKDNDKEVYFENFALIQGCVWGDDSSWKLQVRDISRAHEGIITSPPIDYLEMFPGASLSDIIIDDYTDIEEIILKMPVIQRLSIKESPLSVKAESWN